jgi:hypothetical protein
MFEELTKKVSEDLSKDPKKCKTRLIMSGERPITGEDQWNYKRHYKKVGDRTTRASLYMQRELRKSKSPSQQGHN